MRSRAAIRSSALNRLDHPDLADDPEGTPTAPPLLFLSFWLLVLGGGAWIDWIIVKAIWRFVSG